MRYINLLTALGLAAALAGCAAAPPAADDRAELKALADAWDRAIVAKDRPAIEANMAADFRQIDSHADLHDKAGFVHDIVEPQLTIDPYEVQDFEIRQYGDTALLSGRLHFTGTYAGKRFASDFRYIDIYVRRGGRWQVVSVQITPVPKPPGAAASAP